VYPGLHDEHLNEIARRRAAPASAIAVIAAAEERFGRYRRAGVHRRLRPVRTCRESEAAAAEKQFATNVFGTFSVTRAVLPVMRTQWAGRIVTMSSNRGIGGVADASTYSSSEFALEALFDLRKPEFEP